MDVTLYKMLASGGRDFDQLRVYYEKYSTGSFGCLFVHLHKGDELVRIIERFFGSANA